MPQDDLVKIETKGVNALTLAFSHRDADTVLAAILNPPPANANHKAALVEHEQRVVSL